MFLGGLLVVYFGTFQHPALSHSFMHAKHSLTLLITDYTHHCILYLVTYLINIYFVTPYLHDCLPFVKGFEPVRDKWGLIRDI